MLGLSVDMSDSAEIIVLTNALAGNIIGAVTDISVWVLADVNVNVLTAVMTALECVPPVP